MKDKSEAPPRIMLAIEVPDVAAAFEELTRHGATTVAEPYRPDADERFWLATAADPDGNYVQLAPPCRDG